jgi:NADP-dependent 3-hydroxy acid dehydrogenase YdfG
LWSCDTPPAFPVPGGPPKTIALDVRLAVYVPGTWTADGFSETLRLELAKYNIRVVGRRSRPEAVARIDLGRITFRGWQEVDADIVYDDQTTTPLGRIRVEDLSMTTLDVAAQPVAVLIARWIWRPDVRERHALPATQ